MDRCGDILRESAQTMLKKLRVLVTVGADTSEIVYHDYDNLVMDICKKLTLFTILLESDSAKREISGFRLSLLKGLQQMLESTAEMIDDRHTIRCNRMKVVDFPYYMPPGGNAAGCYLNFLETEEHIFLPTFGIDMDQKAVELAEQLFSKKIVPVRLNEIAADGGCRRGGWPRLLKQTTAN